MNQRNLLHQARTLAGLSQSDLAARARTSRPTLSAYENGHKSPTLDTATRIVQSAGFDLALEPRAQWARTGKEHPRPITLPTSLPRLHVDLAFAAIELPLHLNWSDPGRRFNMRNRRERARVYEIVLREGAAIDILTYVDGALLVDLWDDLVLPAAVREKWAPLVRGGGGGG